MARRRSSIPPSGARQFGHRGLPPLRLELACGARHAKWKRWLHPSVTRAVASAMDEGRGIV